eukprot:Skav235383  [mRNA]  locus=scaffold4854:36699:50647:- [translate_table: standard]
MLANKTGAPRWGIGIDLLELAISPAEFNAAVDAVAQQLGDVEFNMQTELRESFECSDASRYNRRIDVTWEYSSSNTTGWVQLSEVPSKRQGLDPSIVENTQVLHFSVKVKPREAPIALVSGPSETSVNCGFVVSAQASELLRVRNSGPSEAMSKSATCETILPIGELITILRVRHLAKGELTGRDAARHVGCGLGGTRDEFGAVSVGGLRGPVVTAPVNGIDASLASSALGSAVAFNEAQWVVAATMTALEAAADLAPPDAASEAYSLQLCPAGRQVHKTSASA